MKLNEPITCSLSVPVLALFLFAGCGTDLDDLPKTATLKVEILSSPNPLTLAQPIADNSSSQPVCTAGDILGTGDSCFYPGTDTKFSILDDGSGKFLFFNFGTGLTLINSQINDKNYTLVASKRPDGSWEIKEVGRGDGSTVRGLHLTVSTDFTVFEEVTGPDRVVYHSKEEFSITQDFDRDFQLNPDATRIAYEVFNGTPYTLSVRINLLLDGEAVDEDGDDIKVCPPGSNSRRLIIRTRT